LYGITLASCCPTAIACDCKEQLYSFLSQVAHAAFVNMQGVTMEMIQVID
jgi:hypothetical protein